MSAALGTTVGWPFVLFVSGALTPVYEAKDYGDHCRLFSSDQLVGLMLALAGLAVAVSIVRTAFRRQKERKNDAEQHDTV